jgi:Tfp pilus assembly protein PilO
VTPFQGKAPRQRQLISGFLGVAGFILWISLFFVPQQRLGRQIRSEVRRLKQQIAQTRQEFAQLPALEAELARWMVQYRMPTVVPPLEEQLPELLGTIAQAARSAQVRLLSIKPEGEMRQLTPGPTGYLELPVQVETSAGYHQVGRFIDALENSDSLLRVEELGIRADPVDIWHHQVSFVLAVYLLPSGEQQQ